MHPKMINHRDRHIISLLSPCCFKLIGSKRISFCVSLSSEWHKALKKANLGRELILRLLVLKRVNKGTIIELLSFFIAFKNLKKKRTLIAVTENWRQFYKQVIFDILYENYHIFWTRLAIVMKLSGNVLNRLLVPPAKFEVNSMSRKSYVEI